MTLRWITLFVLLGACGRLEIGAYSALPNDDSGGSSATRHGPDARSGGQSNEGGMSGAPASAGAVTAGAGEGGGGGAAGETATPDSESGAAGEGGATGGDSGSAGESGAAGGSESGLAGAAGAAGGEGDLGNTVDRSCHGIEDQCPDYLTCCSPSYVQSEDFVLGWDEFAVDAHVSLFYPDALEVTVARFAKFVDDFEDWTAAGNPKPGAGEHLLIAGTGWKPEWSLAVSRASLEHAVSTCIISTYEERESNPELPMNCVNWYEAFAFCIWDGKRLLTEAEWELVAKGGAQDRIYPWVDASEPTPDHAVYGCLADGSPGCTLSDILPVSSKPLGTSRYGARDMAGSVAEWVFDKPSDSYDNPCNDCANLENAKFPHYRVFRGGGYSDPPDLLRTERRNTTDGRQRLNFVGFRCARSVFEF